MKVQQILEARYASDTIRLSGTLVAGRNRQHQEPITIVITKCGDEEDYGFTQSRPCTLLDFEGGPITAQYVKANIPVDFGEESQRSNNEFASIQAGGWYVSPSDSLDDQDWIIYERPPGYKKLREARYSDPSSTAWLKWLPQNEKQKEFANSNRKVFDRLYKEMKQDFVFFYETVIDMIDESPQDFETKDRDPQEIVEYWWDQYPNAQSGEELVSHLLKHFKETDEIGGSEEARMFDNIIQAMGDQVAQDARQIVEN